MHEVTTRRIESIMQKHRQIIVSVPIRDKEMMVINKNPELRHYAIIVSNKI